MVDPEATDEVEEEQVTQPLVPTSWAERLEANIRSYKAAVRNREPAKGRRPAGEANQSE